MGTPATSLGKSLLLWGVFLECNRRLLAFNCKRHVRPFQYCVAHIYAYVYVSYLHICALPPHSQFPAKIRSALFKLRTCTPILEIRAAGSEGLRATSSERARRWIALSARRGSTSSTSTGSVSATTSGRCTSTGRNGFLATTKRLLNKFSSIVKAIGTATLKDVLDALDGSAGAILTCSQMLRHLTSPPCLVLRKAALTLRGVDALRMPETDFLAVAERFSWWMQERICICMHDT